MKPNLKGTLLPLLIMLNVLWANYALAQACTPAITSSGTENLCRQGQATLTASEAASYQWSTGATTRSITVTEGGAYWVKTVTADGCEGTSETVTVAGKPDASIINPIYNF
ncbi:MAG: hypothetical protein LPK07_08135, partial [Hymenobacteraceae bacterium]|nr:hypothetical protein [Hymenobacteraceae bacterium]